jgi:hypothetical protein
MSELRLNENQLERFVAARNFVRFGRQPACNARAKLDATPLYSFIL